ncbi:Fe-S-containing protein [Campylobacter corcagiensis]|uniref:DUF2318 domain-containing protein n=1 Tax=Campylobacter corcagiensis TaxID=1448857 RepID=A0A7M1LEZ0_9BACT|nr:Fe-S-containing protein [Campylobacter corcagiensis]QKF64698.1 ferrirhodotorulic acid ABC transporter, permease protein [Campylobacter corcagiensis]QOQ87137.1 DUF2318 domain-containing protein [Campylobacter corcagiensis]
MSIFFVHIINAFLPLVFFITLFYLKDKFINLISLVVTSFVFGYFAYFIALKYPYGLRNLYLVTNLILAVLFILSPILLLKIPKFIKFIVVFLVSFGFSVKYFYVSNGYEIFDNTLLDTLGIKNFSFVFLGLIFFIVYYFCVKISAQIYNKKTFSFLVGLVFLIINLSYFISEILLILMRKGVVETSSTTLSFVAKSLHYEKMFCYFYIAVFILYGALTLLKLIKNNKKTNILDIKFRKNLAYNNKIKFNFFSIILSSIIALTTLLYYDLHASKPLAIDEPTIVEPSQNDEFVFDINELKDNKLHRYAYISDDGKTIRFFMINKYPDRLVPTAVFDSCMICGDKGYVKKGDELICVACNVRIFLPSVGKMGGCNPIPFNFRVEKDKLIIPLSEIMLGANYFSEVREKLVIDPVSKNKIINLKAKFNYVYGDKTYFFESEENKKEFIKDPSKYVKTLTKAHFRVEGYKEAKGDF